MWENMNNMDKRLAKNGHIANLVISQIRGAHQGILSEAHKTKGSFCLSVTLGNP